MSTNAAIQSLTQSIEYTNNRISSLEEGILSYEDQIEKMKAEKSKYLLSRQELENSLKILAPEEIIYSIEEALEYVKNLWSGSSVQEEHIHFAPGASFRTLAGLREQYDQRTRKEGVCTLFYILQENDSFHLKTIKVK